jgi:hypothetical protein
LFALTRLCIQEYVRLILVAKYYLLAEEVNRFYDPFSHSFESYSKETTNLSHGIGF